MVWSKIALFLSGLFFGGAIDHLILALTGSEYTPYGVHSGVRGNWVFAVLDGGVALFFYFLHHHLEKQGISDAYPGPSAGGHLWVVTATCSASLRS
jgi:hypothetical protein